MDKQAFGAALAAQPQAAQAKWLLEILDTAIEAVGEEAFASALTSAFDAVIVPLDIPWTPEFVEQRVEAAIRANIPALVKRIHAAVHTD